MFDVVSCGFEPAPLEAHLGYDSVVRIQDPRAGGSLAEAHDRLLGGGSDRPIAFVHLARRDYRLHASTIKAIVRGRPVVSVGLDRPLTGLAAAATWLQSFSRAGLDVHRATSYVVSRMGQLMPTYGSLSSVAGLDLPGVGMAEHMMSWLPGTRFSVGMDTAVQISSGPPTTGLDLDARPWDLISATSGRRSQQLNSVIPRRTVQQVELPMNPLGGQFWGRAQFAEHTLLARSLSPMVDEIEATPVSMCDFCIVPVLWLCANCGFGAYERRGLSA